MLHIGTALSEMSGGIGLSNHKLVDDLVSDPVGLADGQLRVPEGAGLGIEVDEGRSDEIRSIARPGVGMTTKERVRGTA